MHHGGGFGCPCYPESKGPEERMNMTRIILSGVLATLLIGGWTWYVRCWRRKDALAEVCVGTPVLLYVSFWFVAAIAMMFTEAR